MPWIRLARTTTAALAEQQVGRVEEEHLADLRIERVQLEGAHERSAGSDSGTVSFSSTVSAASLSNARSSASCSPEICLAWGGALATDENLLASVKRGSCAARRTATYASTSPSTERDVAGSGMRNMPNERSSPISPAQMGISNAICRAIGRACVLMRMISSWTASG